MQLKIEADEKAGQFSVSQRETQMQAALFENAADIKASVSVFLCDQCNLFWLRARNSFVQSFVVY